VTNYALTRLGEALIAIWGVVTIVFFVTRLLGDPAALLLPVGASPEQLEAFRSALGLDLPIWKQYVTFLGQVLAGDFGQSFQFTRPAIGVVAERMPATIQLALTAMVLGTIIGGTAGAIAATQRGTLAEFAVMTLALLGQATPVYGGLRHLVLPAITLAVFVSASIARLLRSSMLDVLKEDYVRTARAKGLMPRTIFVWHVARNALIPVVTMIGILTGELLGGSVVTETVFAWPGVGRLIVQGIETKDFPVIQAGVAIIAVIYVAINLAVDLLYAVLDPRIKARA
jgi:peptide/nickel transport system permease protein